jgi:anti-sigma regulatory factor (Ser/Thr protein kinase)
LIRYAIESDLEWVAWLAASLKGLCQSVWLLDEIATYQLELCVVEAVTNSVVHAHQRVEQLVEVVLREREGGIDVEIWDEGDPLPDDLLERGEAEWKQALLDPLLERGRGIGLVLAFGTEVRIQRAGERNVLRFFFATKGVSDDAS